MTHIIESGASRKDDFTDDAKREFILAAIRRASANLRGTAYELDEIGVSLKHNMITPDGAVSWLDYIGAVHIVNVEPFTNKIEAAA